MLCGLCLAAFAVLLFSCSPHYHSERFAYLTPPPDGKNIVLRGDASDFAALLEAALRAKGWNTLESEKPDPGTGSTIQEGSGSLSETIEVPYTLEVTSTSQGKCLSWDDFVEYQIQVIDNRTGKQLFSMEGQQCDSEAVHRFMSLMDATGPERR
jgi:hypothetical protein